MPSPLLPHTQRLLLAAAARTQCDGRTPSLVAGVVREGGLAWSCGRGDVAEPHEDVQYRLGSISKSVTAVAVMRLRDEGLLDLDDPLERHVPGTVVGDRTVGQLLGHLAGVTAESPGTWWERSPGGALGAYPLAAEHAVLPLGRRFHYSNLGFGLLGELVARLRGRSWEQVVRDEVLLPLGMTRTTPRPSGRAAQGVAVHPWADVVLPEPEHDAGMMAAAGQLWATLADLGRFGAFLVDPGDVLSCSTLEEMCVPGGVDGSQPGWSAYGLGLQVTRVDGRTLVGHGGSMPGFLAMLLVDREEQTGGVVLTNATAGVDLSLASRMLATVREHEPRVVDAWSPTPLGDVPLDVLGPWYWGPSPLSLRLQGDGLLALAGLGRGGRASRFRRRDDGRWVGLDGYYAGEVLEVSPRELRLATFVFTREPYDPAADVPGGVDEAGWR